MRAASTDDVPELHRLIETIEVADQLPIRSAIEEVRQFFDDPNTDPALDIRVIEHEGRPIAWGLSQHRPTGVRLERAFLLGGVHPEHRGRTHGQTILGWQLGRARTQLAATPADLPAFIMIPVYETESDRIRLAESAGFTKARFSDVLQRPLTDLAPVPPIDGIEIRRWADSDAESSRHVYNAAFADHWGSAPSSREGWAHLLEGHGSRLDLSFVAIDEMTGDMVGYSLNDHFPDDIPITGRRDGWVGSLGTLRSHRKRGIASALVVASMHAFLEAGLDGAMLGVDTENPSGAYAIYERLGFRPAHREVTLRLTVRD